MNREVSVNLIVQVNDLTKQYKTLTAVNGISFDVQLGDVDAQIGDFERPNHIF